MLAPDGKPAYLAAQGHCIVSPVPSPAQCGMCMRRHASEGTGGTSSVYAICPAWRRVDATMRANVHLTWHLGTHGTHGKIQVFLRVTPMRAMFPILARMARYGGLRA
jgi:hypothetical protein